ncbi:MAG: hypothetical protein AAFQ83_21915 [Bacteroidota bacterium]
MHKFSSPPCASPQSGRSLFLQHNVSLILQILSSHLTNQYKTLENLSRIESNTCDW